jgi:hypothetical protein
MYGWMDGCMDTQHSMALAEIMFVFLLALIVGGTPIDNKRKPFFDKFLFFNTDEELHVSTLQRS